MPKLHVSALAAAVVAFFTVDPAVAAEGPIDGWAIAEFGEPLYAEPIEHWPYANPDAPKGGEIVLGALGSFDSLNTVILLGTWPRTIGFTSDGLMEPSSDDLLSVYGGLAESVEVPADRSSITFNLRPEARFHDGHPVEAEDFAFALDSIREHGRPFLRSFLEPIDRLEVEGPHRFTLHMNTRDRMKPLVTVAQVLGPMPKHWWDGSDGRDISRTTLETPPGTGAYRISAIDPGRSITYTRVEDYWAADLPTRRGLNNFDEIRVDYYQDSGVMFEAFVGGKIDFWQENRSQRWVDGYDFDAVREGRVVRETLPSNRPEGTQGFIFNMRRAKFQDRRVREALIEMYDFEAVQRTILYGQYTRARNYFIGDGYGHEGPPEGEELALLEPFRDQLPEAVFQGRYEPPVTDGSGRMRAQRRRALGLLTEAGYEVVDGELRSRETGEQLSVEILMQAGGAMDRVTLPFVENLRQIGIDADIRQVDSAQYDLRTKRREYDMVVVKSNFFPPPGPELRSYYGSAVADEEGSGNWAGIEDPVVDALIEQVIDAETLDALKVRTRALDRVLSFGLYYVPHWYNEETWVAYWDMFDRPERLPRYSTGFPSTWWVDPAKADAVRR